MPLPKKQGADRNDNSRRHCICIGLIQRNSLIRMANVFPHSKSRSAKLDKGEMHGGFRLRSVIAVCSWISSVLVQKPVMQL